MSAPPRRAFRQSHLAVALLAASLALFAGCGPRDVQAPEALVGHYEGNIAYRDATLPVDLDVALVDGRLAARASVPAMLVRDRPVEGFEFRSPKVRFRLPMGAESWSFDGWFRRSIVSGTFSGGSLPLTFNRNTLPHLGLRRVVRPPDTLAVDTVRFAGGTAPLAGTVLAPRDSLAHPAVVLLHDAGDGTRAGVLELADRFARAGMVALAFDERGQGASAGDPNVTLAGLELDAVEAMEFLRHRPGVDPKRVGLVGRGRGGLLVPRVAARVRTAFAVAISPPGVPLERAYVWRGAVPAWAKAEAHADPAAPWGAITSPALVLFGERDDALPREGAANVRAALRESGAPDSRVETVPRADHELRLRPRRGEPFDFPRVSPAALDTLFAWARRHAGLPPAPPRLVPPAR